MWNFPKFSRFSKKNKRDLPATLAGMYSGWVNIGLIWRSLFWLDLVSAFWRKRAVVLHTVCFYVEVLRKFKLSVLKLTLKYLGYYVSSFIKRWFKLGLDACTDVYEELKWAESLTLVCGEKWQYLRPYQYGAILIKF